MKACSKAGRKCSGLISSNGGVANGVTQAFKSGFDSAGVGAAFGLVSDIASPDFRADFLRPDIARDRAFLGLLRLLRAAFSERLPRSKDHGFCLWTRKLLPPARSSGRPSSLSSAPPS